MKRFRIRDNVPDAYVKQSRDFQLLCDLFDIVNNGVKFDIDSIMDLSNTQLTRESMLPYLQSKLGLVTSKELPQETLRIILKCFPSLVKKKGSKRGILEAICLFLNIIYADCGKSIQIFHRSKTSIDGVYDTTIDGTYVVAVYLNDNVLKNLHILDDLLKYMLPTGYVLNYKLAYEVDDIVTNVHPKDSITITLMNEHFGSAARKVFNIEGSKAYTTTADQYKDVGFSNVAGAVGATIITRYVDPYKNNSETLDYVTNNFKETDVSESEGNK